MDFCSIASGSSGNCIFVGTEETGVLVDAGVSGKKIQEGLRALDRKPEELSAILITHEHSDHIKGLGVMARRYGLPVYCTPGTRRALQAQTSSRLDEESLFHEILPDQSFLIGDLRILPFRVSHDAAEPVAYRLECGEKKVAVATDLGYYDEDTVRHLQNLDVVLVESNHDIRMLQAGRYPYYLKQRILGLKGHLSNDSAGRLLCEILHDHLKAVFLGHLSKENNYEELALETVRAEITMGENPYTADDFPIRIAKRDAPSVKITL